MNHTTLSSVTLATIENYRSAANEAARAYQLGSQRLINALNSGINEQIYSRTSKVAPQFTESANKVRGRVTQIVLDGIDQITTRTEKAVEVGSDGAAQQVNKVAKLVAGIDNTTVANGLHTVARLSLPGAKVALTVSGKVADGAKALASAAAGKGAKPVVKAAKAANAAKATAAKTARTTARTTVRNIKRKLA